MKKCLSLLLVLALLLTAVPVQRAHAAETQELEALVRRQVEDYALSISQEDSGTNAIRKMLYHSMFRKGATLKMDEDDVVTAAMFNTGLLQDYLSRGIVSMIQIMQEMGLDSLYASGGLHWYDSHKTYHFRGWLSEEMNADERVGMLVSSEDLYGDSGYPGANNSNDQAMILIAGTVNGYVKLTRVGATADTVTYRVDFTGADSFEFDEGNPDGYGDALADLLNMVGSFFNKFMFYEYDWSTEVSFQIEVPNTCDHKTNNYQWSYDAGEQTLNAKAGDGFAVNGVERLYSDNGSYYYHLEDAIQLRHDQEWVMEYSIQGLHNFSMSTTATVSGSIPHLRQFRSNYFLVGSYEWTQLSDEDREELDIDYESIYIRHYYGKELTGDFRYSSKHTYTFRLDNEVAADGSNMIYLTVYDETLGATVVERTAMNDYFIYRTNSEFVVSQNCKRDWVSGQDIIINYIGSTSYPFTPASFEMTVWEAGKPDTEDSFAVSGSTAADCINAGETEYTCWQCGCSYTVTAEPLGHTPGEEVRENETATSYEEVVYCTVCGEELSRTYVKVYVPGDINGDGEVNNKDATRLFQYLSGWDVEVEEAALNVNGDGSINNKDATRLFQYLSGWDVEIH